MDWESEGSWRVERGGKGNGELERHLLRDPQPVNIMQTLAAASNVPAIILGVVSNASLSRPC